MPCSKLRRPARALWAIFFCSVGLATGSRRCYLGNLDRIYGRDKFAYTASAVVKHRSGEVE